MYINNFEQRDTREPLAKSVPFTKKKVIFDYGKMTRYFILTGYVKGTGGDNDAAEDDAYDQIDAIETAVEDWWSAALYTALPTLVVKYSPSNSTSYTGTIVKFNKRKHSKSPHVYHFTLEFLFGQETQPS
jgi:hypothetical protein